MTQPPSNIKQKTPMSAEGTATRAFLSIVLADTPASGTLRHVRQRPVLSLPDATPFSNPQPGHFPTPVTYVALSSCSLVADPLSGSRTAQPIATAHGTGLAPTGTSAVMPAAPASVLPHPSLVPVAIARSYTPYREPSSDGHEAHALQHRPYVPPHMSGFVRMAPPYGRTYVCPVSSCRAIFADWSSYKAHMYSEHPSVQS